MALTLLLFFIGTFAAIGVAVLGLRSLMDRGAAPAEVSPETEQDWSDAFDSAILKDESLSTISFWDALLNRFDGIETMKARIAEAGMSWSVGRLTAMMLLAGAATAAMLGTFDWVPLWVTLTAAAFSAAGPYLTVLRRREKRLRKLEEQFPEALDSLARSLRAGNSLASGMEILARECPMPLALEFRKVADERALGLPLDTALANLSTRLPVAEVSQFVAATQLQARTGGRLHEVLGRLAETMREAAALKSEIRSIAAHGRVTGGVLTILPVAIAVMMMYVNPAHMLVLWNHPIGKDLIGLAIGCLILAHFVIRKLVDIRA